NLIQITEYFLISRLHEQALGGHSPEHVIVFQGCKQAFGIVFRQFYGLVVASVFIDYPIDSAMVGVSKGALEGISLAVWLILEGQDHPGWCLALHEYIVLDDEIVPVSDPNGTI